MPKLMELRIEVEEIAFGHVMRALHHMPGVAKVHFDMNALGKKPGRPHLNGHVRSHASGINAADYLMGLLTKQKTLTRKSIGELFSQDGRSPSVGDTAVYKLKKMGLVMGDAAGFSLTKKGRDRAKGAAK